MRQPRPSRVPSANAAPRPDTHGKALRINLNESRYGSFAEIGAGQEVARWFFRVGGAAGTIAKSMSAYDMSVSDAIYGAASRYVSRERLESMLEREFALNLERLASGRGDRTAFFAFANTVSAMNFRGTNACHGWIGVRFQAYPRDQVSQILLHVRLLDPSNVQQQEAVGIVGVNLLYAAFFHHHEPDELLLSLVDQLEGRVEIDVVDFSGIAFRTIDPRLTSLKLVELGLAKLALFGPDGRVREPSESLYKRPVLVERGSFRPVTRTNLDILDAARSRFKERLDATDGDAIVSVAEITMRNLTTERTTPDPSDFLNRADVLCASGLNVLVTDHAEYHRLTSHLRRLTTKPIGLAMGAMALPDLFDPKFYADLEGGLLEALGRMFRGEVSVFVYPFLDPERREKVSAESIRLPRSEQPLYDYLYREGRFVPLDNHDEECLSIKSRDVLARIAAGDSTWETMVPRGVAELIKGRHLFGHARR
ncbi:MAG: hypothetical protein U0169_10005 [Polyangiaceae bacterium]